MSTLLILVMMQEGREVMHEDMCNVLRGMLRSEGRATNTWVVEMVLHCMLVKDIMAGRLQVPGCNYFVGGTKDKV
jgi:hypothetical protein